MTISYLFLKPQEALTPEGRDNQWQTIEKIIKPALKHAHLWTQSTQLELIEAKSITEEVVRKIYEVDLLIIDANHYETAEAFQLSPYLCYYMALGHSLGNRTILITKTIDHWPHSLVRHHTLTYSDNILDFIEKFAELVETIQQEQNSKPDNPIQAYLNEKKMTELVHQHTKSQQEIAAQERELERLRALEQRGNTQPPLITFRKVN